MSKTLQDAFDAASRLPEQQQDALAAAILEEVALEQHWNAKLTATRSELECLADEALADDRAGRTEPLDPDGL